MRQNFDVLSISASKLPAFIHFRVIKLTAYPFLRQNSMNCVDSIKMDCVKMRLRKKPFLPFFMPRKAYN